MVYMLPGESYKEADLLQIHDQALKDADVALLEDAWEVHLIDLCLIVMSASQLISIPE